MNPQAANLSLCESPKIQRVFQTTNGGAAHPQDLRLVWVQPQSVHLHPLQYDLQAALKGQNGTHCFWGKGDVELGVIIVLMT